MDSRFVPVEPTDKMVMAGDAMCPITGTNGIRMVWDAMLSAAPPVEGGEAVAWMYRGDPYFDGRQWHGTNQVTTSKQLAMFNDSKAIPLYTRPAESEGLLAECRDSMEMAIREISWFVSRKKNLAEAVDDETWAAKLDQDLDVLRKTVAHLKGRTA